MPDAGIICQRIFKEERATGRKRLGEVIIGSIACVSNTENRFLMVLGEQQELGEIDMTISAYIVNLLKNYDGMEIDTNHMAEGSDQYGLFKSPSRDVKEFNDSSYEITEYYQFLARQRAVSKSERKEADEWLEDLTYWVDDFPLKYSFPELDKNREVIGLVITGSPYPMEADDKEAMYQISLSITYIREREEL